MVRFNYKFETKNQRFFDIVSSNRSTCFYPNIQGDHNLSVVNKYISKYDNFIEFGQLRSRLQESSSSKLNHVYDNTLNTNNKENGTSIIRKGNPKSFVIHYNEIQRNLKRIFQNIQ